MTQKRDAVILLGLALIAIPLYSQQLIPVGINVNDVLTGSILTSMPQCKDPTLANPTQAQPCEMLQVYLVALAQKNVGRDFLGTVDYIPKGSTQIVQQSHAKIYTQEFYGVILYFLPGGSTIVSISVSESDDVTCPAPSNGNAGTLTPPAAPVPPAPPVQPPKPPTQPPVVPPPPVSPPPCEDRRKHGDDEGKDKDCDRR